MFDSYRFLVVKNQIFILRFEENFGWVVGCLKHQQVILSSSSNKSSSLGCFQGSLVSDSLYLSLLMVDLMFYPMNMIILDVSCCSTCGM